LERRKRKEKEKNAIDYPYTDDVGVARQMKKYIFMQTYPHTVFDCSQQVIGKKHLFECD